MSGKVESRIVVDVPVGTAYNQWTQFEEFPHFMDGVKVAVTLEYLPEGMLERVGELLHVVGRQTDHDLKKFKNFIEQEGHATGAWRKLAPGTVQAGTGSVAGEPVTTTAAAGTSAQGNAARDTTESLTGDSPQEYNRFAHPFDQTGGLVDLEGESDESADGEYHSRGDRKARRTNDRGYIPPLGGGLGDR